jgi:endonuclease YncB( thermonuclease family)
MSSIPVSYEKESTNTNTQDKLLLFLHNLSCDIKTVRPYLPDIHYGKVIKVYDGDTITIVCPLYNGDLLPSKDVYKFNVRILGIDTAELKTKCAIEHTKGIIARDALSSKILHKIVKLENVSYDKYGRILCNILLDDVNISEWLISTKMAVSYDGGTKHENWGV